MSISSIQPTVRCLCPDDADEFWRLRLEALRNEIHSFGASYEDQLNTTPQMVRERLVQSDKRFVLGAFNSELVGMVGWYRFDGAKRRHKGGIWGMYVKPSARGLGVARMLMVTAIQTVRAISGVEHVTLSVVTENESAINLYKSLGFEIYGTEKAVLKVDGQCFDEYLMALDLSTYNK